MAAWCARYILISLCHRWGDDNSTGFIEPGQIPVDADVIDKQPAATSRRQTTSESLLGLQTSSATSCRAVHAFTPRPKTLSSRFPWTVLLSPTVVDKNKCVHFYLPVQRLENFALISGSDKVFTWVIWGDQQWFREQSPSPILHKEPNMVCLGVRTLFRSGSSDVNCLNKSWEEPLTCLQTSHNCVTRHYIAHGQVIGPLRRQRRTDPQVNPITCFDYKNIGMCDWFAGNFVNESKLKRKKKNRWSRFYWVLLMIDFGRRLPAESHLIDGCKSKVTIVGMRQPHYPLCLMGGKTLTPSQSVSWVLRDPYFWRLTGCWWFCDYSIFWKRSFP